MSSSLIPFCFFQLAQILLYVELTAEFSTFKESDFAVVSSKLQ